MEDHSGYQRVAPERVRELKFRTVAPEQVQAIKQRIRNISRGGIIVQVPRPVALDTVAEVVYEPEGGGAPLEAVGIVRWVDEKMPGAGIQFIRVTSPTGTSTRRRSGRRRSGSSDTTFIPARDVPSTGTPAATTVFSDGATLVVTGELGATAYNGFVTCWAKTLAHESDRLIIDLTSVQRISSMGVGLLVGAHMDAMKQGKSLTIKVPIVFQRLFAVAGVDRVLSFVYIDHPDADANALIGEHEENVPNLETQEITRAAAGEESGKNDAPVDPVAAAEAALREEMEKLQSAERD